MVHRAKAPLRVSFAGGGTDVAPYPEREGGLVLSAAINRYAYGLLAPRADDRIHVESVDLGMSVAFAREDSLEFDGNLDLVKAAIRKVTRDRDTGYDLFLRSSAPPGSGLGSSSAMCVALVGLLKDHQRLPLSDYEIADLAHTVERRDLGISGGKQDFYSAAFGGFNFIEFDADRVLVNPLKVPFDVIHELEHTMLLAFTGTTRASTGIIDDQTARLQAGNDQAMEGLRRQKELAIEMKSALLRRRLTDFGALLADAWEYKKQLSPRITTSFVDELYEEARRQGALGGKVLGAGGGGYMLFFCPFQRKHRVAEALERAGAEVSDIGFDLHGLSTWSMSD